MVHLMLFAAPCMQPKCIYPCHICSSMYAAEVYLPMPHLHAEATAQPAHPSLRKPPILFVLA